MNKQISRGTPDQLLDAVRNKIAELGGVDVESSFVYPEDMEALEDGEYESHVTEAVNASDAAPSRDVLDYFRNKLDLDTSNVHVKNYAKAVADYLDTCDQAWTDTGERSRYTLDDWYNDTKMNYPDELAELENYKIISSATDIDNDYLLDLQNMIEDEIIGRHSIVEDVEVDSDDDNIYLTITFNYTGDMDIYDYTVPFEDLTLDVDSIHDDVDYIVSQIDADLDSLEN